jgi:hypothetical protein
MVHPSVAKMQSQKADRERALQASMRAKDMDERRAVVEAAQTALATRAAALEIANAPAVAAAKEAHRIAYEAAMQAKADAAPGAINSQAGVNSRIKAAANYSCKACRTHVFEQTDISEEHTEMSGQTYFLTEPPSWMGDSIYEEYTGKINCPKCKAKLGVYNTAGVNNGRGQWVAPAFQMTKSKLDRKVVTENNGALLAKSGVQVVVGHGVEKREDLVAEMGAGPTKAELEQEAKRQEVKRQEAEHDSIFQAEAAAPSEALPINELWRSPTVEHYPSVMAKDFLLKYIDESDEGAVRELLDDECEFEGPKGKCTGREQALKMLMASRAKLSPSPTVAGPTPISAGGCKVTYTFASEAGGAEVVLEDTFVVRRKMIATVTRKRIQ